MNEFVMRKKFLVILVSLLVLGSFIWAFGLFPVMRVNGEFILYRAYTDHVSAFELFQRQSSLTAGGGELTPAAQQTIRQSVLRDLIVHAVFRQYIGSHTSRGGIEERAHGVVDETLRAANADVLPRATKELYGWSVEEFSDNVLFPQALLNELQKEIEKDGASFDEFVRTELNNAQVSIYFVPWKWENGELAEK
ncbi:MAG: hypothetical protein G01um101429_567 [Parcubacteria group bacterium Gr01-1014_29]|nr:MAG: hypothetical protein G01um101429_567 [Parcubacteria group bacterium Gr01-1014_29]